MSTHRIPSSASFQGAAPSIATPTNVVAALDICGNCLTAIDQANILACGRCQKIAYCDRDCQKTHWKVHKLVCKPKEETPSIESPQASAASLSPVPSEYAEPVFDSRKWKLGRSLEPVRDERFLRSGEYQTKKEYVLARENMENYSELLTIEFSPLAGKKELDNFEKICKEAIHRRFPNSTIDEWQVLYKDKTNNEWMWRWSIKTGNKVQCTIARTIYTFKGIHQFNYVLPKSSIPEDVQAVWIKNLKAIEIKKN